MVEATISRKKLIELLTLALDSLPTDSNECYDLSSWKYYYYADPRSSFMKELTMPPRAEMVGDVWDDIQYLSDERPDRHMPPEVVLERLSHILLLLGSRDELKK